MDLDRVWDSQAGNGLHPVGAPESDSFANGHTTTPNSSSN